MRRYGQGRSTRRTGSISRRGSTRRRAVPRAGVLFALLAGLALLAQGYASASPTTNLRASLASLAGSSDVSLTGPSFAFEGNTKTFTYSWSDPSPSVVVAHAVDCGPSGVVSNDVFAPATLSGSFACTFRDDSGSSPFEISASVTVDTGETGTGYTYISVFNMPPSVKLTGPTQASEGGTASFSYTWTDPGAADTFPDLGHAVDCGPSGTVSNDVFSPATRTGSFDCTFVDDSGSGVFTITATVRDDDGGAGARTAGIAVANVAPVVASSALEFSAALKAASCGAPSDTTATLTVSFSDPGTVDTQTAGVDWGDGSVESLGSVTSPFSATHTYASAGTHTATVTITDNDGASSTPVEVSGTASAGGGGYTGRFLPPLGEGKKPDVFQYGRTIPVKVRFWDCQGLPAEDLSPTITMRWVSGDSAPPSTEVVPSSSSAEDVGNTMTWNGNKYIFRLDTTSFTDDRNSVWEIVVRIETAPSVFQEETTLIKLKG